MSLAKLTVTLTVMLFLSLCVVFVSYAKISVEYEYGLQPDGRISTPKALISTNHTVKSARDLEGEVSYLTFGFSECLETCPSTMKQFAKLRKALPSDANLIFVSIDRENDDVDTLRNYLNYYDANITGWIMPDKATLNEFASSFGITVSRSSNDELQHKAGVFLIDNEARVVRAYHYPELTNTAVLMDYLTLPAESVATF